MLRTRANMPPRPSSAELRASTVTSAAGFGPTRLAPPVLLPMAAGGWDGVPSEGGTSPWRAAGMCGR